MARYPGLDLPPKAWHHNVTKEQRVSYEHVKRRLSLLEEAGLVDVAEDNSTYYSISELGLSYVEGEVDVERMEELDPRPDPEPEPDDDEAGEDDGSDADPDTAGDNGAAGD